MNDLNGYDIEDLSVGMSATFSKTITEADIVLFAGVSGDTNAIHVNEEYAATTAFKGRIAHGFLSASVISAAVANRLPGPGAIYMDQRLKFLAQPIVFRIGNIRGVQDVIAVVVPMQLLTQPGGAGQDIAGNGHCAHFRTTAPTLATAAPEQRSRCVDAGTPDGSFAYGDRRK